MAKNEFIEYRKYQFHSLRQLLFTRENGIIVLLVLALCIVGINLLLRYYDITITAARVGIYEPPEQLQVVFFDVNRGSMVGIFTPSGKVFLYDGGEGPSEYRDTQDSATISADNEKILSYLRRRLITEIDAVILAHTHGEHYGRLLKLCRELEVKNFIDPGRTAYVSLGYHNLHQMVVSNGINYINPVPGENLLFAPDLQIQALTVNAQGDKINTPSIVLRLVYGSVSFLLTGDVETEMERQLFTNYRGKLPSDVLQIAHYGNRTSSTVRFINAVHPSFAIIPAGNYNSRSRPNEGVVNSLTSAGAQLLRTEQAGRVTVSTSGSSDDISIETAK